MSLFQKRQDQLQKILQDKSFITQDPKNIFYLTGFQGSFGIFVQSQSKKFLISDSRYKSEAEKIAQKAGVEFKLYDKQFSKDFGEQFNGEVLVETTLTLQQLQGLEKQFPNLKLLPQKSPVEKLRAQKDPDEIKRITEAQNSVDSILFPFLKQHAQQGITEQELAYRLRIKLEEKGKYEISFPPIVAFGKNSAHPHHTPGPQKLEKDQNILVDCGVKHQGYCSDMTRNLFFGTPSKKYETAYQLLLHAQELALQKSTAGTKIKEIDQICRQALKDENKFFTHSLGHGVGLEIHEEPGISGTNEELLQENQIITIEPGLYYPEEFGIRIEDILVITQASPLILSKSSKDLLIL